MMSAMVERKALLAEISLLREEYKAAIARAEAAERDLSELPDMADWVCFDCNAHGPFRVKRYSNPITGGDVDVVCGRCQSANTGEPSDRDTQELIDRAEAAERERDALTARLADYRDHRSEGERWALEEKTLRARVAALEELLRPVVTPDHVERAKQAKRSGEERIPCFYAVEWIEQVSAALAAGGEGES